MMCALTVRKLKPGTFEDFRAAFMQMLDGDQAPPGWVRFDMVRNADDPDEVICFGFFDGSVDELRRSASEQGRDRQQAAIAPFVESVGTDGIFEVVEDLQVSGEPAGRMMADCRRFPSETGCTLTILGEEEEVVRAASQHAVSAHGHEDTDELRSQLRGLLEPASRYRPGARSPGMTG